MESLIRVALASGTRWATHIRTCGGLSAAWPDYCKPGVELAAAVPVCRQALADLMGALGPAHRDTVGFVSSLARLSPRAVKNGRLQHV